MVIILVTSNLQHEDFNQLEMLRAQQKGDSGAKGRACIDNIIIVKLPCSLSHEVSSNAIIFIA